MRKCLYNFLVPFYLSFSLFTILPANCFSSRFLASITFGGKSFFLIISINVAGCTAVKVGRCKQRVCLDCTKNVKAVIDGGVICVYQSFCSCSDPFYQSFQCHIFQGIFLEDILNMLSWFHVLPLSYFQCLSFPQTKMTYSRYRREIMQVLVAKYTSYPETLAFKKGESGAF